jgi:HD-GYP domain-containing protein (c-di-GMP phosphodiesterase class II)
LRSIDVHELKEGDVLAKDITTHKGDILLRKGSKLRQGYIKRFVSEGVHLIYIEDSLIDSSELNHVDMISDTVRLEFVKNLYALSQKVKKHTDIFHELNALDATVNKVIDDIKSQRSTMVSCMSSFPDDLKPYIHPLNVAIYSLVLGLKLGYNDFKLKDLALGASLHDIGKAIEGSEHHTLKGFKVLKQFSATRSHVALQHHEYFDGTGEPNKVLGTNIHELARIVAVANEFDYYTFSCKKDEVMPTYLAIEKIQSMSGKLDPLLVKTFVNQVALYPVGSFVKLNTGAYAVVADYEGSTSSRPVVIQITGKTGIKLSNFIRLNLMENKTVFIKEILPEIKRDELGLS